MKLPRAMSSALAQAALAHGLRLMPGSRFAADRDLEQWLHVPCVLPVEQLEVAIERLAGLVQAVAAAAQVAPSRSH